MRAMRMAAVLSVLLVSATLAADYLPLKEGNQWTYSMSNGTQMTSQVVGFGDVGPVRCGIVETDMGGQIGREYLAADAKGLKTYMGQAQGQEFRYDPPVMRVKLPYREGDTWTATVNQSGMSMTTNFQSLGKERIETPAGTFDCIKVRSSVTMPDQPPVVSISYYAEGVGAVHQVMQVGEQELVVTLTATNVRPVQGPPQAPEPPLTPTPQAAGKIRCPQCGTMADAGAKFCPQCGAKLPQPSAPPTNCPKCNAKLPAGAKFCPSCGEKIAAPAPVPEPDQPAPPPVGDQPALEKYQSADGKVLLYKPNGWVVQEGEIFGEGTYAVSIMEPQENAAVVFMTFPVDEQIKDSVMLAARCTEAIREEYPDLKTTHQNSTPERNRTIAEMTLTAEGEKGIGHGYFFQTERIGTVYLLLAREDMWNELRPTLTTVAANLAFAPEGVAAVQRRGQELAAPVSREQSQGQVVHPAALIKQASQQPGPQVSLQQVALPDQSMAMQIPQGWKLEGQKLQFIACNNPQTRTHGIGYVSHTIIPMDMPIPGAINAPYQPPARALKLVLESGQTTRDVQVLSECLAEQAAPELAQSIQQMRAQGLQVDARLIHARFKNVPTGMTQRGLFTVQCTTSSMSPVWQVVVQGSWAPENEYDQWLPLYLRIDKSIQVNQQWMGQEMQGRAVRQQQLNRDLQTSIAGSQRAFDDYMGSLQDASRSRDYTSHMWSQTTLGQGTWVAENEGARVYETNSWGIQGPEGQIDSPAYNTTNFTGENPWGGGSLELVNTRPEYERYIAN